MTGFAQELSVAKDIARKAGVIMKQYFESGFMIERKVDDTPVTIADTEINRLVIEELEQHFKDGIIGEEESTAEYGMGRRWLCDPIDGTKAFTWGVPTAMFSLGLVVDGVPNVGVAHDPFLGRMYEGVKGAGSFCNGTRLAVSKSSIQGSSVGVSSVVENFARGDTFQQQMRALLEKGARPACFSGAVYKACLIARGTLTGYFEELVTAHDMAAVHVIVEEAGGKLTDFAGNALDYSKPFRGAIVSNCVTHCDLLECAE